MSSSDDEYFDINELQKDNLDVGKSKIDKEINNNSDDDDELQIAFKQGLLNKSGLFISQIKKREPIYKKEEMLRKMSTFNSKNDWINNLQIKFNSEFCYNNSIDQDLEREAAFYKQSLNSVQNAKQRLKTIGIPINRPSDYFAEMAKGDNQMDKIRRKILQTKNIKERKENAKRLRDEKKFARKVQKTREEQKLKTKKKLLDATKKHKKGNKEPLEEILKNSKFDKNGGNLKKNKMNRTIRNKKYGFGGRKKGSKRNDKKSFNFM
ncbi:hypothetical protein ACQ4LE_001174 [Meloidogyne hapla]|uniref:rRNA-processing protein EBP2 n=1 Tax=Meloidogyne hapla TaxID=6305 RepID=A0A1I8BGR6_MELHA